MKHRAIILAAVTLLASCSIYHPQSVDMPLIQQRGEVRADVAASASAWLIVPDVVTVGATGTYGVTDWMAAQLHANYGFDNWYVHAAPGLYKPIGEKFVMESYVGFGYGGVNHTDKSSTDQSTIRSYNGSFALPFVQVDAGWRRLLNHVDIAFGIKTGVFMPNFEYIHYKQDEAHTIDHQETYTNTNMLLEPQIQLRIGGERVSFTMRYGYTWLSHMSSNSGRMNYDRFTISAGLGFTF